MATILIKNAPNCIVPKIEKIILGRNDDGYVIHYYFEQGTLNPFFGIGTVYFEYLLGNIWTILHSIPLSQVHTPYGVDVLILPTLNSYYRVRIVTDICGEFTSNSVVGIKNFI